MRLWTWLKEQVVVEAPSGAQAQDGEALEGGVDR